MKFVQSVGRYMSEKLIYSRFFPPRNGQGLLYYLIARVKSFRRVIKYSWQRARRGWAGCDTWSIDYWFCATVPDMLRKLADDKYGVPTPFVTYDDEGNIIGDLEERWKCFERVLLRIADDLEAPEKFWESDFGREFGEDWRNHTDEISAGEEAAEGRRKAGLMSFCEWFDVLWS